MISSVAHGAFIGKRIHRFRVLWPALPVRPDNDPLRFWLELVVAMREDLRGLLEPYVRSINHEDEIVLLLLCHVVSQKVVGACGAGRKLLGISRCHAEGDVVLQEWITTVPNSPLIFANWLPR